MAKENHGMWCHGSKERNTFGKNVVIATVNSGILRTTKGLLDEEAIDDIHHEGFL